MRLDLLPSKKEVSTMKSLALRLAAIPVMLIAFAASCNQATDSATVVASSNGSTANAVAATETATESESHDASAFILASRPLESGLVEATFALDGMTCGGCEGLVETTLGAVAGVESCDAVSKENKAVITYDPAQTNPDVLLASLQSTGFKPKVVNAASEGKDECCGGCADKAAAKTANGESCCGGCSKDGKDSASCDAASSCASKGECSADKDKTSAAACTCKEGGECTCADDCKCAPAKKDKSTQAGMFGGLLAAIFPAAHAAETKPKAEEKKLPKLPPVTKGCERATFSVEYCCAGGCPPNTEAAVKGIKGVAFVKADYPTMTCTVDFRPKETSKDKIKQVILDLGYPVDGEQPKEPHKD
jgi:copper chaperone CopZ